MTPRPIVLQEFPTYKKNSEDSKTHMYADSRGLPTIAIGFLFTSAQNAADVFESTKTFWSTKEGVSGPATAEMAKQDYEACVQRFKEWGGNVKSRAFAEVTKLRLSEAGVTALTQRRMKGFATSMKGHVEQAKWDEWPADAQFACIASMWGPGVWSTVKSRYPKFAKAIADEDFAAASKLVAFKSNGNDAKRKWLNKSIEFMLANAAAVMPRRDEAKPHYAMNPNVVYWPSKWDYMQDGVDDITVESDWMSRTASGKN